jgi:hypothetical protein
VSTPNILARESGEGPGAKSEGYNGLDPLVSSNHLMVNMFNKNGMHTLHHLPEQSELTDHSTKMNVFKQKHIILKYLRVGLNLLCFPVNKIKSHCVQPVTLKDGAVFLKMSVNSYTSYMNQTSQNTYMK